MISNEEILTKLRDAIQLDDVYVRSDDGNHFQIVAVSDTFLGMGRVKKQQTVYGPLAEYIANKRIHALSIKTYTCEEWHREQKLNGG